VEIFLVAPVFLLLSEPFFRADRLSPAEVFDAWAVGSPDRVESKLDEFCAGQFLTVGAAFEFFSCCTLRNLTMLAMPLARALAALAATTVTFLADVVIAYSAVQATCRSKVHVGFMVSSPANVLVELKAIAAAPPAVAFRNSRRFIIGSPNANQGDEQLRLS